jgi:hypothetical protein
MDSVLKSETWSYVDGVVDVASSISPVSRDRAKSVLGSVPALTEKWLE